MMQGDEYSHEWGLWDADRPLTGSVVSHKSDLASEIAQYDPRFRLIGNHYLYHCPMRGEIHIWHFRRYPLKDGAS